MKTQAGSPSVAAPITPSIVSSSAAPIVALWEADAPATAACESAPKTALERAIAFAEPLLQGQRLDTGEAVFSHAQGVADILASIGGGPSLQVAAYLVYAGEYLQRPEEIISTAFGPGYASLFALTRKLVQIQRATRDAQVGADQQAEQTERARKMLLAFSRDLRVVLLRLSSRLQTLRWFASSKTACPASLAAESRLIFAPLANRLGIWQIKWELEDLAFRFLQPEDYRAIAALLAEKRVEREAGVEAARRLVAADLQAHGIAVVVHGRPKHLYSIWKKMQAKHLPFDRVMDVRALRVVVADVAACYAALARVQERFRPLSAEFDDYIARPKANGYRSLHTVVLGDDGRPIEVQIRTQAMHEHAEYGVAAHWAYKEGATKPGIKGATSAEGDFEERVAEARKAVLRQLLAWERDFASHAEVGAPGHFEDRIYLFTPQSTVIELPAGATPVDFAYALHTDLGHRCRGARVDSVMVPLSTKLATGQTIEIIAAKEGGPSLDWLNADLGFLQSPRARAKVRAWFNAQAQAGTIARGRELVEKLLQREGRSSLRHGELAEQLGFKEADALFELVGKDEFSLRNIEQLLRPPPPVEEDAPLLRRARGQGTDGGVLVVGVESLLTSLARCCRPVPPDAIGGFVTRGRGVAIHRRDCGNFRHMAQREPERTIPVTWGLQRPGSDAAYPVDVVIEASDRQGLLRDISEVFAKEKMNVIGVQSHSVRDSAGKTAHMTFTVEVQEANRLQHVLTQVSRVGGVRKARRK